VAQFKVAGMQTLNIREMRNALGHLDTLVNEAGELIITRHGKAIARVLPVQGKGSRPTHEELRHLTKSLPVSSKKIIRDMRDER